MTSPTDLRIVRLGPEHGAEVIRIDQAAFAFPLSAVDPAVDLSTFEWERTFAAVRKSSGPHRHAEDPAWAGDEELAGLMTSYSLEATIPGRGDRHHTTPVAGLSWVSVHPDHRRRGVLTEMIRHHLHGLHDDGAEAISGLFASEPAIYGRFGYGESASGLALVVPGGAELRAVAGTEQVTTQLSGVSGDGLTELVQDVFQRSLAGQVGRMSRPEVATRKFLMDRPERHPGAELKKVVVARRDGVPVGYAIFRRQMDWSHGVPQGQAELLELVALDHAAEHALWQRVLNLDLVTGVRTPQLGLDHPLLSWLVDLRVAGATRADALWLRLVDVGRAMTARGYALDLDTVLGVRDDLCPWNAGSWRLTVSGDEVRCEPTSDQPDLVLDVRELAQAYLGGTALAALGAAGLVLECRPGALARLSLAMRGLTEPAVPPMF